MDSDWPAAGGRRRDGAGPPGPMGRDAGGGGFRDGRDARNMADRAVRGALDGPGRQPSQRAGRNDYIQQNGNECIQPNNTYHTGGMIMYNKVIHITHITEEDVSLQQSNT